MRNKILSFLGLAQRSGNLVTGEDTCEMYIKKNSTSLVIIAEDASENTRKKFKDMCDYRNISFIIFGRREELSHAIGKNNRTVYAVKDYAMGRKILELIKESDGVLNKLGGE